MNTILTQAESYLARLDREASEAAALGTSFDRGQACAFSMAAAMMGDIVEALKAQSKREGGDA